MQMLFYVPGASDDEHCHALAFLTPANAMLSVELTHLADMLTSAKQHSDIASQAREFSSRISKAIWDTTVRALHIHDIQYIHRFPHVSIVDIR